MLTKAGSDHSRYTMQFESKNKILREKLRLLRLKIFVKKSEKFDPEEESRQGLLFPNPEDPGDVEEKQEVEKNEELHWPGGDGRAGEKTG